ncbi:hypothetical protein MP619_04865 [Streptococcus dysgalactiae]|uniref:Replicase domain protein n=1 Tax=Streptococcus dysgalactiae TaxID=1334 RepID=A0AAE9UNQ5_STRDY|nr:hypothetical protein [Streptococcus dysgalactiae]QGH04831.1 hypothetical protein EA458_10475 [Streptococcus dysgalactiae subsp. dysgalactiae]WAI93930.1 hypothetical protein MP619_04865 [Streptococcus dysgalactiae]WCE86590.1 hypothetical protein PMN45_03125 [Streptococcus dysgalactiae]WCN26585.1 hypothetical protein PP188_03135 [Streptococcus dysgalactiae]
MTKIIGFGRAIGKTTMAILESYATGHYIVCANNVVAKHTFQFATQLGYSIPYPLSVMNKQNMMTLTELQNHQEGIIIDNVENVLEVLFGCPIKTITFNSRDLDFAEDRYIEELSEIKKELNACYKEKTADQQEIEKLKDKCVDMLQTIADYEWDNMYRADRFAKANTRRWRAK